MFKKNESKKEEATEKVAQSQMSAGQQKEPAQLPKQIAKEQKKIDGPKQLSQKESVYLAVCKIVDQDKLKLDEKPMIKNILTKEQLERVHDLVCDDLSSKRCRLKDTEGNQRKLADPAKLRKYVRGMVQNWFRRDDRLNGDKSFK
ncbi:MAG: hypothetical protein KDD58_04625 [Bdellovibrionales bacterium]|nr:hypothetical protein [Bdellovibrionales bacterium]